MSPMPELSNPRATAFPQYQLAESYRWNYDRAPQTWPEVKPPAVGGSWTYCGRSVPSPLGIAAGPLLNGQWILYYAALGFDILTYKTVRSRHRDCYDRPNLQPVRAASVQTSGDRLVTSQEMEGSWAVSFGMPSMKPDIWRADVEWTRRRLAPEKCLAVSVVASPQPEWTSEDLAADFAQCARWAVESGADCVETNFSCPNVATVDGQLYQQPELAGMVARQVREAIGRVPLIIKIGFVEQEELAEQLTESLAPFADALAMTNCITAQVQQPNGTLLFDGQMRGIGGAAIREASIAQVRRFAAITRRRDVPLKMIGVGGIATADHVREYLDAGAEAVQLATAAMTDPLVGCKIRQQWSSASVRKRSGASHRP